MRVEERSSTLDCIALDCIVISFRDVLDDLREGGKVRGVSVVDLVDLGDVSSVEFVATAVLPELDECLAHLVLVFREGK